MAHIPRYLHPGSLEAGQSIPISAERAHHLYTVLRRREGAAIRVWNGAGLEADACIEALNHKGGAARLGTPERVSRESPLALVLVQAVGRGDRFERALMAAVELGVTAIQPLWCEHGQSPLSGPRLAKKQHNWSQMALGAAEQAERSLLPEVLPALAMPAWLATQPRGCILHPGGESLADIEPTGGPWHIVVGPEGGFSEAECRAAREAGLRACRLGPRILRTEHAGAAAIAVLQARHGDLLR